MPYNMWFLTPEREVEEASEWIEFVSEISEEIEEEQIAELTEGTPREWRQIAVTYPDGEWSFDFERRSVAAVATNDDPWTDNLEFFREGLAEATPGVNVQWIAQYLTRVQTVYMFRCSINAPDSNLELVREIIDSLRNEGPHGLLYADLEGWSNEDGQHITWEFSDGANGVWWMALRAESGWNVFQMDLGNYEHRKAFQAGEVPADVEVTKYPD